MKFRFLLLFVLTAGLGSGVGLAQAISSAAQKTVDDYEQYKASLMKAAEATIAVRRDALVRELETRVASETKVGNLPVALAIKAKIEELKSGYTGGVAPQTGAGTGTAGGVARGKVGKIDFEAKLVGWRTISPTATAVSESAHSGRLGLKIEDPTGKTEMFGPMYVMAPNKAYSAQFWARMQSGSVTVGVNCYDAAGKFVGNAGSAVATGSDGTWKSFQFPVRAPAGTNRAAFWIQSGIGMATSAAVDDFTLDVAP